VEEGKCTSKKKKDRMNNCDTKLQSINVGEDKRGGGGKSGPTLGTASQRSGDVKEV